MELETSIVYGPRKSRRFGWDLGINLLPLDQKLCTFDCIYCQYGVTPPILNKWFRFPNATEICRQWSKQLQACETQKISINHTTISGNGEPTMHPHFPEVIADLVKWRNENAPWVKLAVLSNGYRMGNEKICHAFSLLDEPIVKLDTAIPERLAQINRPLMPFSVDRFVEHLKRCSGLLLQTMFLRGWNDGEQDLAIWMEVIRNIRPREVQIFTATRLPAQTDLTPLSDDDLLAISTRATEFLGIPVHAYCRRAQRPHPVGNSV
jgi:wyosine [tRNA(Phe)-imidazoG37] synthetase (radical SAM superfamily)